MGTTERLGRTGQLVRAAYVHVRRTPTLRRALLVVVTLLSLLLIHHTPGIRESNVAGWLVYVVAVAAYASTVEALAGLLVAASDGGLLLHQALERSLLPDKTFIFVSALGGFVLAGILLIGLIAHARRATETARRAQQEAEDRKQVAERQALHDALTGLPNRTLLFQRAEQVIQALQRDREPLALLLLDLDHFKEVNDSLGHHHGDLLLQAVAARLRHALGESDVVARLGGDEFAALLPGTDCRGAVRAAENMRAALDARFELERQALHVDASIGIALYPEHGPDAQTLLREADVAMYQAKHARAGHAVYSGAHDEHRRHRWVLASALPDAIASGQLVLHYQPQVALALGRADGVEALVRWSYPPCGLVSPDEFIPLAEHTGLIVPLTRWVLEAALRQRQIWQWAGYPYDMGVNLSMANLRDPELPATVAGLLQRYEIPPGALHVEFTESTVMSDPARSLDVLARLAALGMHIVVDDFGIDYSSLAYLKRLPVDAIKIDRSFVQHMSADKTDAAIVRAIIGLGHELGLRVVAEGVEDGDTWDQLIGLGCDAAQGFYLSRPLPAEEFKRSLAIHQNSWWPRWGHPYVDRLSSAAPVSGGQ